MFNELRWQVIVDIGGIIDHYSLNVLAFFLYSKLWKFQDKSLMKTNTTTLRGLSYGV